MATEFSRPLTKSIIPEANLLKLPLHPYPPTNVTKMAIFFEIRNLSLKKSAENFVTLQHGKIASH
jgi:hypothetical protein